MKPILSICMMVKNEEKNMDRCLRSIQPLMQEISSELIIVDTGSSDRTVEIAKQFTDKVFFHMWNNNFSEIRNITIGYATGQWVLIIDADEEIETADQLLSFLKARPASHIGCATMLVKSITDGLSGHYLTSVSPRLFRRNNHFYYRGAVHNEVIFEGKIVRLDSSLIHYGYIASDKEQMERKFQRTSNLLLAELEKNPDNVYYRYQLSISYSMHGDWPEALHELQKIYERYKDAGDDFWRSNLYVIGTFLYACAVNERSDNEVIQFGLRGIKLEPEYVDLYFFLAQLYEMQGKFEEAYEHYANHEKLVKSFSELNISRSMALQHYTLSLLTNDYYSMGVISLRNGDYVQARQHLRQMLAIAAEDDKFISQARIALIGLDFVDNNFDDSRMIYDALLAKKLYHGLAKIELENEKFLKNLPKENRQRFCQQYQDLPNMYGMLNRLRLSNGNIGEAEWRSLFMILTNTEENILPDYYAPILAYSMKYRAHETWRISGCLSERTIMGYMSYLDEVDKVAFVTICREFINVAAESAVDSYQMVRLQKNAAKYLLFSGELSDAEYSQVFANYVEKGTCFFQALYGSIVWEKQLVHDLKNVEETFLLYLTQANKVRNDQKKYISILRKALSAYPEMNKGIDILLQSVIVDHNYLKMQQLVEELLLNVDKLVIDCQFDEALAIIAECETIVGNNMRLIAKKAEIYNKKYLN